MQLFTPFLVPCDLQREIQMQFVQKKKTNTLKIKGGPYAQAE
jgi:hypothetical protein